MATYFTTTPATLSGDVYATEFTFSSNLPSEFIANAWDFGTGLVEYNKQTVSTSYNYPGLYRVGLSAWNNEGYMLSEHVNVNVDYVYRDLLLFTSAPSAFGIPGVKSVSPFTMSLTSSKIKEPISVVLQAFNTKSVPHYAVPDKWSFITPKWKFIDAATDQIVTDSIPITTTPLYKDNVVVAVSGEFSFYYIDDLSTGTDPNNDCPLLIAATLSTANFTYPPESLTYPYFSYSNSEVARAVISWQVNEIIPTKLKITENTLNDIYPIKWSGVPIPIMITCEFDSAMLAGMDQLSQQTTNVLAYPKTNEMGLANKVNVRLLSSDGITIGPVSNELYTVQVGLSSHYPTQAPLYFKAFDENNSPTSGYIFTTIKPLTSFSDQLSMYISVDTISSNQSGSSGRFPFPDGYPIYADAYISNPLESNINKINIVTYPANCDNVKYYKNLGLLIDGAASYVDVPRNKDFDLSYYALSGTAGIYAMSFNPINNILYAADADMDRIYALRGGTQLLFSKSLSSILTPSTYNTPSWISIDKNNNIWVAMHGTNKLIKFDSTLNYLLSANIQSYSTISEFPPVVETDMNNNIWACFSYPVSSSLIKFNGTTGQPMASATQLALSSTPVGLAINANNNVWVACYGSNKIELYSGNNGTLLKSVSGIYHPSYIAVDRNNNVWVTHGYNFCSVYNVQTDQFTHWKFSTNPKSITPVEGYTTQDVTKALTQNEIWGGLSIDVFDKVWVVDTEKNNTFVFNSTDPVGTSNNYFINPKPSSNYVVIGGTNYMSTINDDVIDFRSAQAAGDWTGNRWYQKYAGAYNTLSIEGLSNPFKIYDIENSFKLAKVNEEFDYANYLKSLALPEILSNNTELFDEFLPAVVGDGNISKESIGRMLYERIANFKQTHGDYETCELKQLLSFSEQLSVPAFKYTTDNIPAQVNRLINLFSVPKSKLRGQKTYPLNSITDLGTLLTETDTISSGQYIVAKNKRYDSYKLVHIAPLSTVSSFKTVYSLGELSVDTMVTPLLDNYYFFTYDPESTGYINNIINWDSDHTTIAYNLSTNEEWYGDNGLVETMFNCVLTKGLSSW